MPQLGPDTVSAMIAPALFLTATGSLILSTANRMGRIVDRVRVLLDLSDRIGRGEGGFDFRPERMAHAAEQIASLSGRGQMALASLTRLYQSFGLFVGTSLAMAVDSATGGHAPAVSGVLAVAGVAFLLVATLEMVREARAATRVDAAGVGFFQRLQELRDAADPHPESGPTVLAEGEAGTRRDFPRLDGAGLGAPHLDDQAAWRQRGKKGAA